MFKIGDKVIVKEYPKEQYWKVGTIGIVRGWVNKETVQLERINPDSGNVERKAFDPKGVRCLTPLEKLL